MRRYGRIIGRPRRIQIPQGVYHVCTSGNDGASIIADQHDCLRFVDIADRVFRRRRWTCLSWCLMTTHYHFLIATPEPDLAAGMHVINGTYARAFNARHERSGHLFEARYFGELTKSDPHLLETMRYIATNPTAGGLCERLEDWPWNGYCEAVGATIARLLDCNALLAFFGNEEETAIRRYRAFVASRPERLGSRRNGQARMPGTRTWLDEPVRPVS